VRQYLGAYRRVADLDEVLRGRRSGAVLVDEKEHARAFAAVRGKRTTLVGNLVTKLGLNHVLDLGCGVGGLLLEVSGRRRGFVGWGVDSNPHMCRFARRALARTRYARIAIYRGDCRRLNAVLPDRVFSRVELITAANVANEFCRDGGAGVVKWLRHLKAVLPGRLLLVADYYGRLGKTGTPGPRHALLHDWVQLISGQGVPPARLADWKRLYASADCELQYEAKFDDGSYFVHLLQL
jgi:SAM-dependent methyltransferase